MNRSPRSRYVAALFGLALLCCLLGPSGTEAQLSTHTVQKGDTLWHICEKYYGDPDLWPKLWQVNPFITNPHLLKTGDVITLLEKEPIKKPETPKEKKIMPEPVPVMTGVDVSSLTNVKALGYLSRDKLKPLGTIFVADSSKMILSKGENVLVSFVNGKKLKQGDEFAICQSSSLIKNPLTGKKVGYLISVYGRLVLKEYVKRHIYKAEITETFRPVCPGDPLIPYDPISSCVQPVSMDQQISTNIVALKDQRKIIGQYSVVYLDRGFNHGIRRGNLFELVKGRKARDPNKRGETVIESFKKMDLPDVGLGLLMVLESRPDTATGLVLSTKENAFNGATVNGLSWVETPQFFSRLPACPIQ